jgi:hypothetical protein
MNYAAIVEVVTIETTTERAQQNLRNYVAIQPDPDRKNFPGVVKLRVVVGTDGNRWLAR